MPIDPSIHTDPNKCGFGLPMDSCVGDGVGDPFAGGKSAGKASGAARLAPKGGDPYAGGKSGKAGWKNPTTGYDGP
jgi:hypothetical protein